MFAKLIKLFQCSFALAVLLLQISCGILEKEQPETRPLVIPGDIIFSAYDSTETFEYQIYTQNLDGSGLQQVTFLENGGAGNPSWSPDGTQILFTSTKLSTVHTLSLYIINADGTNQRPLKTYIIGDHELPQQGISPSWSPDGEKIVFYLYAGQTPSSVWIYDFEMDSVVQIIGSTYEGFNPIWNHDGSRIAFLSDKDLPVEDRLGKDLFDISPLGEDIRRITTDGMVRRFRYDPNNRTYVIERNLPPYEWYTLNSVTLDTLENELQSLNLPLDLANIYSHKWTWNGSYLILSHRKDGIYSYYAYDYTNSKLIKLPIPLNVWAIDIK